MAKLRIKGTFNRGDGTITSGDVTLSGDCQTCGGEFDVTVPYDFTASGETGEVTTKGTKDTGGKDRVIKTR
jgi:hypothetical protein